MERRRKHQTILAFLALALLAGLLAACSSTVAQSAGVGQTAVSKPKSGAGEFRRTSRGGSVTVDVTWENPWDEVASSLRFGVVMNTHSANLDGYDLAALAVLRNDQGTEVVPEQWDAAAGGHHRSGELVFPNGAGEQLIVGPDTESIELVIRNVAGVQERTFRWEVTR